MVKGIATFDLTGAEQVDVQNSTFKVRPEDRTALEACGISNLRQAFEALTSSPKGPAEYDLTHLRRPKSTAQVISPEASDRIERALAQHPTTSSVFTETFQVSVANKLNRVSRRSGASVRAWLGKKL